MLRIQKATLVALFAVLAACAHSTGVLPVGNGSFSITEEYPIARGGLIAAKRDAYNEAKDFCDDKKADIFPVKSDEKEERGQDAVMFTLTFQCVPSKDTGTN